jgi:hypothetical protein
MFFSFLGQIGGFPAQCKFGGHPKQDYQTTCTTRGWISLTSWTGLQSRSERQVYWQYQQARLPRAPLLQPRLLLVLRLQCGGFWLAFFCRRLRLGSTRHLLCHLRHGLFYGGGWTAAPLSRSSHCILVVFFPQICRVGRWNLLPLDCQHAMLQDKYWTTLLEELTSWEVVSITFSFLETRFRATLRDLLGGARRLASKIVGRSSMRGIWGSPGRLNLYRS